jgi:hypothetical protein
MAKEKADSDKRGWFARWRERRKQNKLRASERQRRAYEGRLKTKCRSGGMFLLAAVAVPERQVVRQPRRKSGGESSFGLQRAASRPILDGVPGANTRLLEIDQSGTPALRPD